MRLFWRNKRPRMLGTFAPLRANFVDAAWQAARSCGQPRLNTENFEKFRTAGRFTIFPTLILNAAVLISASVAFGDTFVVSNINDSGTGSLREAINQANANAGPDTIEFDIPGAGPHTIQPTTGLPEITDTVIIDGYTQTGATPNTNLPGFGNNAVLKIELDGSNAGDESGLVITAADCTVKGLVINRFGVAGIFINGTGASGSASGNVVQGNFIGTDATGSGALGNALHGVVIQDAPDNTIGGSRAGEGNVISGNDVDGIFIVFPGARGNVVQGNFIGTDVTGSADLGNAEDGVQIQDAPDNIVGGAQPGEGNIISGNEGSGILLVLAEARGNLVQGNFIGTDVTGSADLGNVLDGVQMQDAPNNSIGGAQPEESNIISGNDQNGIFIFGPGASGNVVAGNFIGTDATGSADLGNAGDGVQIEDAPNNTIGGAQPGEGNVISGNDDGVFIIGTGASGNLVRGNYIGTDATGSADLGNVEEGVQIQDAPDNTIGGSQAGEGNVISGNNQNGIWITGAGASGNVVQGNFIGTDASGSADLGNAEEGVQIQDAPNNTVGGARAGEGNVISGNDGAGIFISGTGASGNEVHGNYIGTDVTGSADLGNALHGVVIQDASDNTIGGAQPGEGNVISGNDGIGIGILRSSGNVVQGNFIGTHVSGRTALGNGRSGVAIQDAPDNIVGGSRAGEGNVISGNDGNGIWIIRASANVVQGNFIGTDVTGSADLGNADDGVQIQDALDNTVGGSRAREGNVIAFNDASGVAVGSSLEDTSVSNSIRGNAIYGNGALGIDLGDDGVTVNDDLHADDIGDDDVTVNDDLDADIGPNNLQNFPVLSLSTQDSTSIVATLKSLPDEEFTLDFYASRKVDASRFGEGERYLGSVLVVTDDFGEASFDVTFVIEPLFGELITATATDSLGSTSEFSQAVVFSGSAESARLPDELSQLTADDRASDDQFGSSLAVNGDILVVGAVGDDGLRGSVYVFARNDNESESWAQVAKLADDDDDVGDQFGFSVAMDGDTIIIGANGDAGLGLLSGAAYVFERDAEDSNSWGQLAKLTADDGDAGDQFGFSVSQGGDTIVVGAPGDDDFRGAVYIFERSAGEANTWGQVAKMMAADGAANDQFGVSVALDGDTIAIGTLGADDARGAVYIFERSGGEASDWEQVAKLIPSDGSPNDLFGGSIGMDGDLFVAGAPGGNLLRGAAYIFERGAGEADTWGQVAKLIASDGVVFDQFGSAVAIDGNTIVVGAWVDDFLRGSAYIFERNAGGVENWGLAGKLTAHDGIANDLFGVSVAVDGDTVIAGAAGDDELRGSAYVFGEIESAFVPLPDANLKDVVREARQVFFRDLTEADLAALTSLSAFGSGITDLTGLENAVNLTFLDLDDNQIEDLSPLGSLTNLTELFLRENEIADVGPLSELANLTVLSLGENQISDLSPLSGLANLEVLFSFHNQIEDLSPLSSLNNLSELFLEENEIADLTPLNDLTELTKLWVNENRIVDLDPLSGLTDLIFLNLGRNEVANLVPLSNLTNLIELGLNENQVTDLSPLADLTDLTKLWVNENRISDLGPLRSLSNLTFLNLSHNEIADLTSLSRLTNLIRLDLHENRISDVSILANLTNLEVLEIRDNPFDIGENSAALAIFAELEAGGTIVTYGTTSGVPAPFEASIELGAGWRFSEWFGSFNADFFPWIFHSVHGWMYVFEESTSDDIFLYDLSLEGWIFTSSATYPSMYSFGRNAWIFYFVETAGPREFVDLATGEFFSVP